MNISGQIHAQAALLPYKYFPLCRGLGDAQSLSEHCGEEKVFCSFRESNLGSPVVQALY
jgi:hypothetical protein